jgi:uncharacterized protein YjbJ (UPF0337 family)
MNADQVAGLWNQLLGSAKERWGALVRDPSLEASGRHTRLAGRIRAGLGSSKADAERQLVEFRRRHSHWTFF